jgi:hypothetical protein
MKLEEISFQLIKNILYTKILLIHHNYLFPLLFYIDSSIKDDYIIMIYQIPYDLMEKYNLIIDNILNNHHDRKLEYPIIYLFKLLNKYEVYY